VSVGSDFQFCLRLCGVLAVVWCGLVGGRDLRGACGCFVWLLWACGRRGQGICDCLSSVGFCIGLLVAWEWGGKEAGRLGLDRGRVPGCLLCQLVGWECSGCRAGLTRCVLLLPVAAAACCCLLCCCRYGIGAAFAAIAGPGFTPTA
jgi:hypothetical protein